MVNIPIAIIQTTGACTKIGRRISQSNKTTATLAAIAANAKVTLVPLAKREVKRARSNVMGTVNSSGKSMRASRLASMVHTKACPVAVGSATAVTT